MTSNVDSRSSTDITKPLAPAAARRLIRAILDEGHLFSFSDHAVEELEKDEMNMVDVVNVLRCCTRVDAAEPHIKTGAWTYQVHTERMCVVVEFRSTHKIQIVTGWREKKGARL